MVTVTQVSKRQILYPYNNSVTEKEIIKSNKPVFAKHNACYIDLLDAQLKPHVDALDDKYWVLSLMDMEQEYLAPDWVCDRINTMKEDSVYVDHWVIAQELDKLPDSKVLRELSLIDCTPCSFELKYPRLRSVPGIKKPRQFPPLVRVGLDLWKDVCHEISESREEKHRRRAELRRSLNYRYDSDYRYEPDYSYDPAIYALIRTSIDTPRSVWFLVAAWSH